MLRSPWSPFGDKCQPSSSHKHSYSSSVSHMHSSLIMCINTLICLPSPIHLLKPGFCASNVRSNLLYIIPRPIKGSHNSTNLSEKIYRSHLIDPLCIPCDFWFDYSLDLCHLTGTFKCVSAFSWRICWWFYHLTCSCLSHNSGILIPGWISTLIKYYFTSGLWQNLFRGMKYQHTNVHHHTHCMLKIKRGYEWQKAAKILSFAFYICRHNLYSNSKVYFTWKNEIQ